ncbi:sensor histidine kinase [Nonomuraea sp. 10N515B]|uniref:sensor histidine kinase n=1 Tax=Nonomuraea sp. 10N515B TaxID=3457422 RepID=UPI003FCE6807
MAERVVSARWLGSRPLIALDCVAAVGFTLVGLTALAGDAPTVAQAASSPWVSMLVAVLVGMPVAVRRVWPMGVFCLVLTASLASLLAGVANVPFLAAGYALYTVALTQPRRMWIPTTAIGVGTGLSLLMLTTDAVAPTSSGLAGRLPGQILSGLTVMGCAWALGRSVRAARLAAERAAEQQAERSVTEERLRIARELHDIVAHSMSLITVKAGVARQVAQIRPEETTASLEVIETTSRSALAELRHVLGVLRAPGASCGSPPAVSPLPGLGDIQALTGQAAQAGVHVDLDVNAAHLPESVEVTVYRIVQEAVTNVIKHAAPTRCRVLVHASPVTVTIEVSDDGPPGSRAARDGDGGHGLIGIRERVLMYGGTFSAGRRPERGFTLTAHLPLQPDAAVDATR